MKRVDMTGAQLLRGAIVLVVLGFEIGVVAGVGMAAGLWTAGAWVREPDVLGTAAMVLLILLAVFWTGWLSRQWSAQQRGAGVDDGGEPS